MNKYKRLGLLILFVIVTSSCLINHSYGKGTFNSRIKEPNRKNPVAIYLPTFYHIWDDRLYFLFESDFFQYDISDRSNITYLSEIKVESYESRIEYYENTMFSFTNIFNERNNTYEFLIDIYELSGNGIEIVRTIKYERESKAHVLCVSQEKIIIRDFDSPIVSLFILDLGQTNPIEYPIEYSGDTTFPIEFVILEDNYLYGFSNNPNWNQASLLIFDVENLTTPELISSWSTTSFSSYYPNVLKKEGETLYICSSDCIAIAINVTDTANPTEIGRFSPNGIAIRIFNNYAIVIEMENITIYDITQIGSGIQKGSYTVIFVFIVEEHLGVFNGLFIAIDNLHMLILDWSNPEELIALDITMPTRSNNIGLEKNWIILTCLLSFIVISKRIMKRKRIKERR
jgi:hypothetical protein